MINKLRNINPRIKFDGNDMMIVVKQGEEFNVWVQEVYNELEYDFERTSNLTTVKVNDYQYKVTANELGFNKITVNVGNRDKSISNNSNSLVVYVIPQEVILSSSSLRSSSNKLSSI